MRRLSSTLILLVLAAGLGAYLYFVDADKPTSEETPKTKVFSADSAKIDQIEIKSASGDVTVLKKDADVWNMVKPVQALADQANVTDVTTTLASLEQDRIVDENATDLATYGLEKPRIDATFHVGGEARRILIGDTTATNTGVYAKLPDDKRVFLISTTAQMSLDRTTLELRDKTVLKFETPQVESLELASANQTVRLVKAGTDWKLVRPIEAPADYAAVEGVIQQLQSAQMLLLKESADDLKNLRSFGLDKPQVTATLGLGKSTAVLQLGSEADANSRWARDPSRPLVFSISSGVVDDLRKAPFDFRRKEIFGFRQFNTTRFEITRDSGTRAFERVMGSSGTNASDTWKQVVPAEKAVDASNFEGALLEFSNLRAVGAVDRAPAGMNRPTATITVKFEDGKTEERVTLVRTGDGVFAARPDQPGALRIETDAFDAAVKKLDSIQ